MNKERPRPSLYERCVLCGAQTDVPLTMPVDCRLHYVEGIGQLCAHCAQRAAGETPNKKTRTSL